MFAYTLVVVKVGSRGVGTKTPVKPLALTREGNVIYYSLFPQPPRFTHSHLPLNPQHFCKTKREFKEFMVIFVWWGGGLDVDVNDTTCQSFCPPPLHVSNSQLIFYFCCQVKPLTKEITSNLS